MRLLKLATALLAVALLAVPAALADDDDDDGGRSKKPKVVNVTLLGVNDFHGHMEANTPGRINDPATGALVSAGGSEYLSTHMDMLGADDRNTYVLSSGDLIGGSPLLSGLFHDEPTIELMNHIGLDFNGVGNHEFDEGGTELKRMQYGNQGAHHHGDDDDDDDGGLSRLLYPGQRPDGCHPVDGCQDLTPFAGSFFKFLAANVIETATNDTIFPPYKIVKTSKGEKVAFIGETLEGTPLIVTPSGVAGLQFLDEADTVNALVPRLKRRGVETIVLLLHQGGFNNAPFSRGFEDVNACENFTGAELLDIVGRLDPEVDVVMSAHTHDPYICRQQGMGSAARLVNASAVSTGRLVTSASSFGRLITKINLTIDRRTNDVVASVGENKVVTQTVPKDPFVTNLIAHYKTFSDPIANRVVGRITANIRSSRAPSGFQSPSGEQEMGEVAADAQREATRIPHHGGSVVAFMNPGGVRDDLLYDEISGGEQPGEVTYGEIFAVQPFGNSLVVKTCTGAQIEALLEQQFVVNRILLPSAGFTYTWDAAQPVGSRVDPSTIKIDGVTVNPSQGYRVTMNSFLADGGDGFTVFTQCTNPLGGEVDVDALGRYIGENSPLSPPPLNRITRIN
jgi:5'-nucleotidase